MSRDDRMIGVKPWLRAQRRSSRRNGSCARTFSTRAGDLQMRIAKLPHRLGPGRPVDRPGTRAAQAILADRAVRGRCDVDARVPVVHPKPWLNRDK